MLAPYIEGHESAVLRTLGRRSLDLFDRFVEEVSDGGLTIQYDRSGTVEVAFEPEDLERHQVRVHTLAEEGVQTRWLDADALRETEPLVSTGACGGLLIPIHGFVGVPDLVDALTAAAIRRGATFTPETRVISVGPAEADRLDVHTEQGTLTADRVVLAPGSWSGQISIAGVDPVPVKPVRGQLLHLAWPTAQPLRHVVWSSDCYIVPWQSGRVLVGATVEDVGFDERATAAGVRDLLEAACTLVPHLCQASFTEVRVGLRPAMADPLPIVGCSAVLPGLIYATGHYRNGVLLAPLTAALVKDLVVGRGADPALEALSPSRFGRL